MDLSTALLPAVVPFLIAGAVLAVPAIARGRRERIEAPLAGGLAVGGAFVAAQLAIKGPPPWPPIAADERLAVLVALAALVAGVGGCSRRLRTPARLGLVLLAAGGAWWLLERTLASTYAGGDGWIAVGVAALSTLLLAFGLGGLARKRPGVLTPLSLAATAGAAAGVLVLGRTASYGQLAGALACAFTAAALLGWWRRQLSLAGGATAAFAFGLCGLLLAGVVFAYAEPGAAALVAAAPLLAGMAELPGLRALSCRKHALLRALLVAAPLVAGLWLAWQADQARARAQDAYHEY